MPSSGKREHVVRRVLADGTVKEYRYQRHPDGKPRRYAEDSVAALVAAYRRSPKWQGHKPSTRLNYGVYLREIELLASWPAKDVRRRTLLTMRDAIATERGHGAANVFIHVASALFGWAVKNDWLEQSPVHDIEALQGGELTAWTAEQADKAIAKLPEAYRRVVLLARYTAQRRADLCALTWSAYDGQTIRLTQQKRKPGSKPVKLVIPVHRVLREELDRWKREATSTHILTTPRGLPWRPMLLTQALPPALARIGLPHLTVHGLRKLAAASLAEAGCSMHEIAAITGHVTLAMVQHYTKSADQGQLADAAIHRLEIGRMKVRK